jgi:hypothetical protein
MIETSFTITGTDFFIKNQFGSLFESGQFAVVQWTDGYNPRYRPLQEWTSQNLTMVNWVGNYDINGLGPSMTLTTTSVFMANTSGPLYIFLDFGLSSNYRPEFGTQVWLGQITDSLVLDGVSQTINLNQSNIRPVVGGFDGRTMYTMDWNTWQPMAVPEPSYSAFACVLFAIALIYKKYA